MFSWAGASLSLLFQNLEELILPTEGLKGQSAAWNQRHTSSLAFQGQGGQESLFTDSGVRLNKRA